MFKVFFIAVFLVGCIDLEANLRTESGLNIYTNNTCYVDIRDIERQYKEVCECVGVEPSKYADEIDIVIDDRLVRGGLSGEWNFDDNSIELLCSDNYHTLKHELGHWFDDRIDGGDGHEIHSKESWEIRCSQQKEKKNE